jgi:two-component system response regulator HydG
VANALRHVELTRKVALLTELSRRDIDLRQMGGIVCTSAAMRSTLEMAQTIAASGFSSVLLTGESGVGKGLLARSIHKLSARQDKPFVELNCSAMPATLVESELFGHQKGAFTDAKENRAGVFELADGGVLFLDEIGDMDLSTQAKLLKVIEEQRFRRLGGTNEVSVDVAVVAATNQNLQQLVAGGRFRSDLYYRLSVFPINIPPLRQRPEDIPLLAASFLTHYARKYGKELEGFTDAASAALRSYSWPGNVRELRNVVERACLLARADAIGPEQLLLSGGTSAETAPADGEDLLPPMPLAKAEELVIRAAMKHARGNRNTAADTLQIHRTTLYKKLREYGITAAGTEDAAT